MMTLNALDKQFIADNMLTDEDFRFSIDEEFDVPNELQFIQQDKICNENLMDKEANDLYKSIDELLREYGYDGVKLETSSSDSSHPSPGANSSENVSVVHIPEVSSMCEQNSFLADTPPHTPPGLLDFLPESTTSCTTLEPIILSVNTVPYVVPCTTSSINSAKLKKNIQPKPFEEKEPITSPSLISSNGQKTVLNSEQLVKLATGTLPTPLSVAIPVPSRLHGSKSTPTSVSNRTTKHNKNTDGLTQFCAAALKRQERIIKNRQSAHESRMRRKEYVENLEAELKQITVENSSLREENCHLKLKISTLENEVLKLKSTFSPKKLKTTFCFMFVVCMVTFNFGTLNPIFDAKKMKPLKQDIEGHHFGRVLLWENENKTKSANTSKIGFRNQFVKREVASYLGEWDPSYNSSSCHHYINKTESLRLENDLLGWVERVEKKQKLSHSRLKKNKMNMKSPILPLPKLQSGLKQRMVQKDVWGKDRNWNEILIYETPRKIYEHFFDELHRREDTFYFVSFSGDHLLLPAIAHNQTHRPRMSFVMPAMTFNDSIKDSENHVSMMQIDCEVMDTKLVYIKHSNIPEHLRQESSNQTDSHQKRGSDSASSRNFRRLRSSSVESLHRPEGKG